MTETSSKTFWSRPEGKTGLFFLLLFLAAAGVAVFALLPAIVGFMQSVAGLAVMLFVLGVIVYTLFDSRMRNLVWYMYKSVMRWITGIFVKIDPISILKSYVEDLEANMKKMKRQMTQLRGQMHKLKELIINNRKAIEQNLTQASKAKENNKQSMMILKSRKAGRLKESNMRLEDLYRKMEVLYRVLNKMRENSEILKEDIKDQVTVKEQERKAIRASHSAMESAMNVIQGDKDKRLVFDRALEAIADDVSQKVGEMEQFMEMSENFMQSVDLQNGIFEEKGLEMLEKWEKEGVSKILGDEKATLLLQAEDESNILDLNAPIKEPVRAEDHRNQYDSFFD